MAGTSYCDGRDPGGSRRILDTGAAVRGRHADPMRRVWIAVVVLVATAPALAACSKPVGGSTSAHDVAWVATGASVTLPGTAVTPVALSRRHIGAHTRGWPTRRSLNISSASASLPLS